jgi:hypothetical protein
MKAGSRESAALTGEQLDALHRRHRLDSDTLARRSRASVYRPCYRAAVKTRNPAFLPDVAFIIVIQGWGKIRSS